MTNFTDLFQPKGVENAAPKNTDEYKVSFKDGKGGIYRSVVRFIPWHADPNNSVKHKIVSWVNNPMTNQGMYVDDPRSVGQYSPVTDMFFKFRNTQNQIFIDFAKKNFSSKQQYAALVQIIQDENHPELQGQIKVWRFGKTVYDKIFLEEHPAMGQGIVPYNPIYGRYFSIVCTSQSGYNNFDQSSFFDRKDERQQLQPSGMLYINPQNGQYEMVTENTDQQVVYDYLVKNSPDLGKYDYQPWTAEQAKHVDEVMSIAANYLQTGTIQQNISTVIASNNSPVFPGSVQAVPVQQPVSAAPAVPLQRPQTDPAAPAMGQMPPVAPAAPAMGAGLSMGPSLGINPMPGPAMGNATVTGVDIPHVEPATVPSAPSMPAGGIGNIDDILKNL